MATTDHPKNAPDNASTPAPLQAQDGQIVSGEAQSVEQDAQEQRQPMPFQRITVVNEAGRDVIHVIGGSRGAEAAER